MRQIHYSAWLLVVLSAILQVIIFPLPSVYVLSWFALAPLIVALLRARPAGELEIAGSVKLRPATPGQGFLLGYLCGILWYAGTCYWIYDTMRQYGGLSAAEAALALFLFCCYLGLYHGFFGLLVSMLAGSARDFRPRRAFGAGLPTPPQPRPKVSRMGGAAPESWRPSVTPGWRGRETSPQHWETSPHHWETSRLCTFLPA